MTALRSFTLLAVLAAATTAFAQSPQPKDAPAKKAPAKTEKAQPKQEVPPADVERYLAFFNKFVDTLKANQNDCSKMAGAINSLIDANQPVIKMAQEAKAKGLELPASAKEKMMARMRELQEPMQKCGGDAKVQAAMMRMDSKNAKPAEKTAPKK